MPVSTSVPVQSDIEAYPSAVTIAPGLHALGSAIAMDGRVSWHPKGEKGFQATRCYLLEEDGAFMLVDPGLRYQEQLLITQLQGFLGPDRKISAFLTRSEPDCFGCLEVLHHNFVLERVVTGGGHNPFDGFQDIARAGSGAMGDVVTVAREGLLAPIPISGDRTLEVLHAALRLNSTFWAYDAKTKTLFSSDSFAHSTAPTMEEALGLDTESNYTAQHVRGHLLAKFWWMKNADPTSLKSGLEKLFASKEIENICSSHGRPIVGRPAVEKAYALMQEALSMSPEALAN